MDLAALLEAIYCCYREKRLADMLDLFDDRFRLIVTLPDDIPGEEGRPRSKAEMALLTHKFQEDYDILEFEPADILVENDSASTTTRAKFRHRGTGNVLETVFRQQWRFADGKALELRQMHDLGELEAFLRGLGGA